MGILKLNRRTKDQPLNVLIDSFDGKKSAVAIATSAGKILLLNLNRSVRNDGKKLICSDELADACKPYGSVIGVTSGVDGYVTDIEPTVVRVAGLDVNGISYTQFIGNHPAKGKVFVPANHFNLKE